MVAPSGWASTTSIPSASSGMSRGASGSGCSTAVAVPVEAWARTCTSPAQVSSPTASRTRCACGVRIRQWSMGTTSWLPARWKPSRPSSSACSLRVGPVPGVGAHGAARLDRRVDQAAEPFQLLDDHPVLEAALGLGGHVLQVAAAALGHVGARGVDPVRGGLEDLDQLGAGPVLAVVDDPHPHPLAGDRARDEDGLALDAHHALTTVGEAVDEGVGGVGGQS